MIFLVSGEGSSDIGGCKNGREICEGVDFQPGEMVFLIDQIVTLIWKYSPLDTASFSFVTKAEISRLSKKIDRVVFPGNKRKKGMADFSKNASALAKKALEMTEDDCPVGAVLFRDTDGTRSDGINRWDDLWDSMMRGFNAEEFDLGVPMIPKPKSEAWLLCALQPNPYTNCTRLEDISGNDASLHPAKKQLEQALEKIGKAGCDPKEMIRDGKIDSSKIDMPSFKRFKERLEQVARKMHGSPLP